MKRRTLVFASAAALAAPAILAGRAGAQAMAASVRLNWYLGGSHGAYVLGKERGFYAEEGINLTINEGRGSVRSVQLIGSREDDFAMADAGSLMLGASRGIPARAVMTVVGVSSFCVVARKDSGISSIKDLEGKRLAVTAGDALTALWPAVVAANRLNGNSIRLVMMDAAAKVPAVLEKNVDAVLGGISDQPNLMRQRNVEPVVIPFYDVGVNTIGMSIIAHPDTIAQKLETPTTVITARAGMPRDAPSMRLPASAIAKSSSFDPISWTDRTEPRPSLIVRLMPSSA